MSDPLASPEVLAALDALVDGLKAGTDDPTDIEGIAEDDQTFYARADEFISAYKTELVARDLDWPLLAALIVLEEEFAMRGRRGDLDDEEAGDYCSAVKTVRDFATRIQAQRAKLN